MNKELKERHTEVWKEIQKNFLEKSNKTHTELVEAIKTCYPSIAGVKKTVEKEVGLTLSEIERYWDYFVRGNYNFS